MEGLEQAAAILPRELRPGKTVGARELRLRRGRKPGIVTDSGEEFYGDREVTEKDLEQAVLVASRGSAYWAKEAMSQGYLTLEGGHRMGICGHGVIKDGEVTGISHISGICIRIAREVPGAADRIMSLFKDSVDSTLIIGPPGSGKTTLLRDLLRQLSDGIGNIQPHRIALVDERGEVAASKAGLPMLNVGTHTDVLEGCPKEQGMLMVLKAMSPQIIAADEITSPKDLRAAAYCRGCGAAIITTIHGKNLDEVEKRPGLGELLKDNAFTNIVTLGNDHSIVVEGGGAENA